MERNTNSLNGLPGQFVRLLRGLSRKQQLLLAGAAIIVAGTLFIFVRVMGTPEMKPLFTGMTPEDSQQLAARLSAKNIRYQLSPDGSSVSVDSGQLDQARLETAAEGVPRSGRFGFELFDKPNWGGSDFEEKVNFQRALEGELERTIRTLRDVEAARVHLVLPSDSVFIERERPAKASVTLRLRGRHLNTEAQVAIANLVAGAVDRLAPENVTVIDADTDRPLNGPSGEFSTSGKLEDRLANRLVDTLEPVVGQGGIRASVHVEYDLTSGDETQESFDPNSAVALTTQRTEEHSGGTLPGGIPGTASNVPASTAGISAKTASEETIQSSKSENSTYAVNRVIRHTVMPAGRIKRLTAALLVDDAAVPGSNGKSASRRKRTPEELKQIEDLARAALGMDTSRGDSISIQNLSFESLSNEPLPPTLPQKLQTISQRWSNLLRYVAIMTIFLIVYAIFLRPIKRQVLSLLREIASAAAKTVTAGPGTQNGFPDTKQALEMDTGGSELSRLKRLVTEKAKAEPASTSRLLQSWLREDGGA
jgi:flagellar M-ring protein FliF